MTSRKFQQIKLVVLYGTGLALLAFLLHWFEYRFLIMDHSFEVYIGAIALLFTGLGIWLAIKLSKPKVERIILEKKVFIQTSPENFTPDEDNLLILGISKREWEVLQLMAQGLSNQEIANQLFVSINTIKTHSSSLFEKLDVKRRIQAIEKAKNLGLLP